MQSENVGKIVLIKCNKIVCNKMNQTEKDILRLSDNIKKNGVLYPLCVRPLNYGMFEVISGNRRLKAAKLAGFTQVPCIIINIDEKASAAFNFIENSLKATYTPFEESDCIKSLIIDYNYTIDELSSVLNMDIQEIINKLRILHFSKENRIKAENENFSFEQCINLLKLENTEYFDKAVSITAKNHLNDYQTEKYVNKILNNKRSTVLFKDLKIFINTIAHTIEKMKSAGINVIADKNENNEKIEYKIVIYKNNNIVIRSRNS